MRFAPGTLQVLEQRRLPDELKGRQVRGNRAAHADLACAVDGHEEVENLLALHSEHLGLLFTHRHEGGEAKQPRELGAPEAELRKALGVQRLGVCIPFKRPCQFLL